MVKHWGLRLAAGILVLCMVTTVLGDECASKCTSPCTPKKCHDIADVPGGCWFNGVHCINCIGGDKNVNTCEDYGVEFSCILNPCGVSGGCELIVDTCVTPGLHAFECKIRGCEFGYRCMADGGCIHFLTSTQSYCNTAYKEHGLFYDLSDPEACERVGEVCREIDRRYDSLSNETEIEARIKNKCLALKNMCLQCQGDCKLRKTMGDIERIIYGIAAGLAILMLTINGIRLLTSEDSVTRGNAKKAIAYVILSLLTVVIAVKFIEYVWITFL